ncbi:MAG TPA: hypothetical protein DEA75_14755 [Rhodobacteraceae bacterium]|nr:hypothetical protein [Paracoccaceae bacterium]
MGWVKNYLEDLIMFSGPQTLMKLLLVKCRSGSICASLTAQKWPPKEPKDKQFLMPLYLI